VPIQQNQCNDMLFKKIVVGYYFKKKIRVMVERSKVNIACVVISIYDHSFSRKSGGFAPIKSEKFSAIFRG
jgi:abortive infection bacteriophage resistance protein